MKLATQPQAFASAVSGRPLESSDTLRRVVSHFSCGAASAVATKLALSDFGHARTVIYNAFVLEEDEDNRRFLSDCERWFNHSVTVLRDEKYNASAREVWRRKRFIKNKLGAACSSILKRDVIEAACLPDDIHVFGFTSEERDDRAQRFIAAGNICPLIDRHLTKADCLALIERAGIELPRRYRQGYNNANCVGCVKGGMGYWNKTRRDSPDAFRSTSCRLMQGVMMKPFQNAHFSVTLYSMMNLPARRRPRGRQERKTDESAYHPDQPGATGIAACGTGEERHHPYGR
jgi:hypothetical protein